MPAFAPHSMLILHTVIRPSMLRPRIVEPRYSTRWPWPNEIPVRPISPRTTSLAVTPSGSSPSTVTARSRARVCGRHWVARTSSTSDVPVRQPQPFERLRGGDLVDQVQVHIEEVGLAGRGADHV